MCILAIPPGFPTAVNPGHDPSLFQADYTLSAYPGCQSHCGGLHTASAYALEEIKQELDIPIIGVVEPGARVACKATRNGRIGVIGTEATVNSGIYTEFIQKKDAHIQVLGKACPLFVPLVEEGWLKDSVTVEVASRYLRELTDQDIDTLILGCTHYPLLRSTVRMIVGDAVTLVNPAYETARELKELLKRENLERPEAVEDEGNAASSM